MKKVLYIGGFDMPDKNAAAQRVLSVAKALREAGYAVSFFGLTECGDFDGNVEGFHYEAAPYPQGMGAWVKYALGNGIVDYIRINKPDYIILYNYPAFAQYKVISYCKKNGIIVIGDITEWYRPKTLPKRIDTWLRMVYCNKRLDGIIAISKYLADYYTGKNLIQLPPMVDKIESKWQIQPSECHDDKIHLVYIGTGSVKDRLDKIVKGIRQAGTSVFTLDVIGISKEQYLSIYQRPLELTDEIVTFHGRLPHKEALQFLVNADFQIFFRDNIRVNNAGFPTKFVESMSAGVPVITNRISNIGDYINNGENSFMINHPEEFEIIEVLKTVSRLSRQDIEQIKERCLKKTFDYTNFIEPLQNFMQTL